MQEPGDVLIIDDEEFGDIAERPILSKQRYRHMTAQGDDRRFSDGIVKLGGYGACMRVCWQRSTGVWIILGRCICQARGYGADSVPAVAATTATPFGVRYECIAFSPVTRSVPSRSSRICSLP